MEIVLRLLEGMNWICARRKIIYEDRETEKAPENLDKALNIERDFLLIIKMKENQE